MKLVEILTSAIMHGHVFHQKPSFDERAQGSPSGLIVIEEGAEDDAPTTAFDIVNPQVLFGVYLEARVVLIPQRRAIHRVGRQPSDGRDASTFQVRRDEELLDC